MHQGLLHTALRGFRANGRISGEDPLNNQGAIYYDPDSADDIDDDDPDEDLDI